MTIGKLKQILQNVIDECEDFEDEQEISLVSNTYFLKGAKYFLGISGYDGGYLDLGNISENVKENDEDGFDDGEAAV